MVEAKYLVPGDVVRIRSLNTNLFVPHRILSVSESFTGRSVALRVQELSDGDPGPNMKVLNPYVEIQVLNPRDLTPESERKLRDILDDR